MFETPGKMVRLRQLPLFKDLSHRELDLVARLADEIEIPAGRRLTTAGNRGQEFIVIAEGTAVASFASGRRAHFGAGDFLGEMSLIDGGPQSATVESDSPVRLFVFGQREFYGMLYGAPFVAKKIMSRLSLLVRRAEALASA
jgi:CRP-like cAMP-binding protein